jgi:divalent metal cation (Fe/Co/Zn/Cd) transporter
VVLAIAAVTARSVALAGFGVDSLIEIGASTVVIWQLSARGRGREQPALRLIGLAFLGLAIYLGVQSSVVLATKFHPRHSALGIAWTGATAGVMFALAAGKVALSSRLDSPVLRTEARVTLLDGLLATAIVVGLALSAHGWWWADPGAGYVLLAYGLREARATIRHSMPAEPGRGPRETGATAPPRSTGFRADP